MPTLNETRRASLQVAVCLCVALAWRLSLAPRYFGWEEGDYGNVMMVREVLDSSFTWFRTAHMPGWYSLGAIARSLWPDPRVSALGLTMFFSVANVGIAVLLSRKLLGAGAAWMVGIWLIFQPEMALYGASTLRSPVFTSLGFAGMALLIWGGRSSGFGLTAAAFLVRMEGFFIYYLPALWSWARDGGRRLRSLVLPLAILSGVVLGWQIYITEVHGESFFLRGPFEINLAPDVHGEMSSGFDWGEWLTQGWASTWGLLHWTLPRKLGWTWCVLAVLGTGALLRGTGRPGGRVVVVYAGFALAFWLGEGMVAHHHVNPGAWDQAPCGILDPEHNLYWVWLLHAVPFLALLAGAGWAWLERRLQPLSPPLRGAILGLVIASALPGFANESVLQLERSDLWNRPQLELSTWLEEEAPRGSGVLVSGAPEVWLKRKKLRVDPACDLDADGALECWTRADTGLRIFSWWTLPDFVQDMSPEEFADFLLEQRINYLMWFEEGWTDANKFAGFLGCVQEGIDSNSEACEAMTLGDHKTRGSIRFTVLDHDPGAPPRACGYGWRLFGVHRDGAAPPPAPPLFGHGDRGRGWAQRAP